MWKYTPRTVYTFITYGRVVIKKPPCTILVDVAGRHRCSARKNTSVPILCPYNHRLHNPSRSISPDVVDGHRFSLEGWEHAGIILVTLPHYWRVAKRRNQNVHIFLNITSSVSGRPTPTLMYHRKQQQTQDTQT